MHKKPWTKPVVQKLTRDEALEVLARHPKAQAQLLAKFVK